MTLLLRLVAGAGALGLLLAAAVTAADGLGIVRAALDAALGPGMLMPPDEVDGGTWGWARLAMRVVEAAGLVALAVGIGLGAAGSRLRGVAGLAAAVAGAALAIVVLASFGLGAGALGDRVLAPFIRADFDYQVAAGPHLRLALLLQAGPGLAFVLAGIALAVHAWAPPRLGVAALLAGAAPMLGLPLRSAGTAMVFSVVEDRYFGATVWATVEGLVHLGQLAGDGLVAMAGVAGLVAVALLTPRPAPADG